VSDCGRLCIVVCDRHLTPVHGPWQLVVDNGQLPGAASNEETEKSHDERASKRHEEVKYYGHGTILPSPASLWHF
jgi:hypothetical protein